MATPSEEPLVADSILIVSLAEAELLRIADTLHDEADCEQNDAGDVAAGAKGHLGKALDPGRVQNRDGQRDGPDPDHLEDPEAEEREELVTLIIEAVILARLQDSEEQEARQPDAPGHDEERGDDLARIVFAAECKGYDG